MKEDNWPQLLSVLEKADRIAESINEQDLCPKFEDLFKAYELTSFKDTKVVILDIEPVCTEEATGLCFATKSNKISTSNRVILNSLRKSDLITERLETADFSNWAKQGVLMLNLVLSTQKGYIRKHHTLGWQQLTKRTLVELTKKKDSVVFMLWGKEIQLEVEPIVKDSPQHLVLKNVHPLSEIYGLQKFSDKGDFKKANDWLIAHGKTPVQWDIL